MPVTKTDSLKFTVKFTAVDIGEYVADVGAVTLEILGLVTSLVTGVVVWELFPGPFVAVTVP